MRLALPTPVLDQAACGWTLCPCTWWGPESPPSCSPQMGLPPYQAMASSPSRHSSTFPFLALGKIPASPHTLPTSLLIYYFCWIIWTYPKLLLPLQDLGQVPVASDNVILCSSVCLVLSAQVDCAFLRAETVFYTFISCGVFHTVASRPEVLRKSLAFSS